MVSRKTQQNDRSVNGHGLHRMMLSRKSSQNDYCVNAYHLHNMGSRKSSQPSQNGHWVNAFDLHGRNHHQTCQITFTGYQFRSKLPTMVLRVTTETKCCARTLRKTSQNFHKNGNISGAYFTECREVHGVGNSGPWPRWIHSLWPSDTIWRQWSGSTMAQVMACCLTAQSHYLNQCWLIISKVTWHSSEGIIMTASEDTNQ